MPEFIMSLSNLRRLAVILVFSIAVAACATTQWKQDQAESHMNIGAAFLGSERFNDALKEFFKAEEFTPGDPKVHYYMGIAYHGKGLNDQAIVEFNKALSLKPDYSEAYNFLGTIFLGKGLWDKAIEAFNSALSNTLYDTPDKALFNMGRAYHGKGDYKMALNKYREAKSKKPNTIPPFLIEQHMGVASFADGNMENAVNYFRKSLEIEPSFLESRYWLGQCYIKLNNLDEAKAQFQIIITTAPEGELRNATKRSLDSIDSVLRKP
jgi:type IV pilus assembly protein PilF